MEISNTLSAIIYKSFDSPLSKEEQLLLDSALVNSSEAKQLYDSIAKLRLELNNSNEPSFPLFFEEKVLQKLKTEKSSSVFGLNPDFLTLSFRQVILPAIVLLVALIVYNINSGNNNSIKTIFGSSTSPVVYSSIDPLHDLQWSNE